MKLQRFVGKNTKSVLDEIRTTLGDEALIVSNTKVGSKTEIIAACDSSEEVRPDFNETQTRNPSWSFQAQMTALIRCGLRVTGLCISQDCSLAVLWQGLPSPQAVTGMS